MGDLASVEKARRKLEDLYLGVPDESVNLTFQDLAEVSTQQQPTSNPHPSQNQKSCTYSKLPSLDFNRARSEPPNYAHPNPPDNHHVNAVVQDKFIDSSATTHGRYHGTPNHGSRMVVGLGHAAESSIVMGKNYDNDDMSHVSGKSMSTASRRRPGIPHSNICALCTTYIYLFRHRCLVCGRVYCRHCVRIGMGEMAEGRKCVDCLGRRFSPRYIQIAGQIGCCVGYPSTVKQQELKWAEKGPRTNGKKRSGRISVASSSRSPAPRTPTMAHSPASTPSFVMNPPYSTYAPSHHYPLPL